MFTSAGNKKVVIGEIQPSEPKFSKAAGAFDLCVHVTDASNEAESDWVRLEMSTDYGKGNFANRTQAQITMETLAKLGYEGGELDMDALETQLAGKTAIVHVAESTGKDGDKKFYNAKYFVTSGGNEPTAIDKDEMKRRLKAMTGGAAASAGTAAATGTAAPPKPTIQPPRIATGNNPFAKKPTATATA
jgi:hypothetical protein